MPNGVVEITDRDQGHRYGHRYGLPRPAVDELLVRTGALTTLVASVLGATISAMQGPVVSTRDRMLRPVQRLISRGRRAPPTFRSWLNGALPKRWTVQIQQAENQPTITSWMRWEGR